MNINHIFQLNNPLILPHMARYWGVKCRCPWQSNAFLSFASSDSHIPKFITKQSSRFVTVVNGNRNRKVYLSSISLFADFNDLKVIAKTAQEKKMFKFFGHLILRKINAVYRSKGGDFFGKSINKNHVLVRNRKILWTFLFCMFIFFVIKKILLRKKIKYLHKNRDQKIHSKRC